MMNVIRVPPTYDARAERLRLALKQDQRMISFRDLGTGAGLLPDTRSIASIARRSLSPAWFSSLYQRMIAYFRCRNIVELGTSLGINTLYLAQSPGTNVYTFEGAESVATVARENFASMEAHNITLVEGDIGKTLRDFTSGDRGVDFAFIDANHTRKATTEYFEGLAPVLHDESVVVLDDIHITGEMERAWLDVQQHGRVSATVDLYRCGMAFFTPSLDKQHVVLKV